MKLRGRNAKAQQTSKPPRTALISEELGGIPIHDTLQSKLSTVPTELPAGSDSNLQHNTTQRQTSKHSAMEEDTLIYSVCRRRPTKDEQLQIEYIHACGITR